MRILYILLLIINIIVISVGEDSQASTSSDSANPTSSLEKGVEGLVKIVHSFLKNVQSEDFVGKDTGSISFNDVERYINEEKFGEFANRWKDLVAVFGGFAACVVIGLLFMLCLPVAGCINCCCYCCCKKCGRASSKEDPTNAKCKRLTFGTILFIFATLMLVGAIFAVISNEILHSKFENIDDQGPVGQVNSAVKGILDFADKTADDIVSKATTKAETTISAVLTTIQDATSQIVTDIKDTINATKLLNQVEDFGQNANNSVNSLNEVKEEVNKLKSLGNDTTFKINDLKAALNTDCPSTTNGCPNLDSLTLEENFNGLSDLSAINDAVQLVTGISAKASDAKKEFDKVQSKIEGEINNTIKEAKTSTNKIKDDILIEIPKVKDSLQNMTKSLNITKEMNEADTYLKKYGDYIWYGFIAVPCVMLLIVMFYFFGLLFGMFGDRPGPGAPCCNKGAGSNMLCCGVTCSYLLGSIIMLVVIIMFLPFGLLYTNGCQYLNDGVENIERFEFVINNSMGYNIAKFIDKDKKSPNITVGSILSNCKKNQGVYDAFHLENLFSIDDVLDMSQITTKIDDIVSQGAGTSLGPIDIIPTALKTELDKFAASGVDNIDFSQYDDVLNKTLVNTDLPAKRDQLEILAVAAGNTTQANKLRELKENVLSIEHDLERIELSRANLSLALDHLKEQSNLTIQVQKLIDSLTKAQTDFNTNATTILSKSLQKTSDSLKVTVSDAISEVKTEIRTLGPCKDVYNSVQKLSDALCVTVLDPVNSIWFGLGWGLAFFIPCIIFALCTASLYQREEPYDKSFHTTRKLLKKRGKEESTFDNPDIDMYQGQGYDAYNGQGADNIPLTGMRQDHPGNRYRPSNDGLPNHGYQSPEHRGGNAPNHRSSGYPADYHHGYSDDRMSSPPPYNGHHYDDGARGRSKRQY